VSFSLNGFVVMIVFFSKRFLILVFGFVLHLVNWWSF